MAGAAADAPPRGAKEGFLTKRGHVVRNWKRRYFVLSDGVLAYYADKGGVGKGRIELNGYSVFPIPEERFRRPCFEVTDGSFSLYVSSSDRPELEAWAEAINAAAVEAAGGELAQWSGRGRGRSAAAAAAVSAPARPAAAPVSTPGRPADEPQPAPVAAPVADPVAKPAVAEPAVAEPAVAEPAVAEPVAEPVAEAEPEVEPGPEPEPKPNPKPQPQPQPEPAGKPISPQECVGAVFDGGVIGKRKRRERAFRRRQVWVCRDTLALCWSKSATGRDACKRLPLAEVERLERRDQTLVLRVESGARQPDLVLRPGASRVVDAWETGLRQLLSTAQALRA